jgi:hypothetical protein
MTETDSPTPRLIEGLEIVATEPGLCLHPNQIAFPGVEVPAEGITRALLADARSVYLCDDCLYYAGTAVSVRGHRNGTHRRVAPHRPITAMDTIAKLVYVAREERQISIRGYAIRTRDRMAKDPKHKPVQGVWTASGVASLFTEYDKLIPKARRREPAPSQRANGATVRVRSARAVTTPSDNTAVLFSTLARLLAEAGEVLRALEAAVADLTASPELVLKARKFDELQALMGRGNG